MHHIGTLAPAGYSTHYSQRGLSWTYDRYGNRTAQSISAGCVAPQICPTNSVTVSTTTNRITGAPYSYDLNGNMTNDGLNSLTYDAENRPVTSSGSTYTYDGNNLRVKKISGGTTTVYVFSGTKVIAEYANGALSKEYIYTRSALLATIAGTTTTYHHPDQLSVRASTDSSGNLAGQQGHYPYGESWYSVNTTTKWQFTSYERDSESGNDYAMARYHVNRLGRFSAPDPIAGSVTDPQSLNRYAYVANDPVNLVDPSGLLPPGCEWVEVPGEPALIWCPSRFDLEILLCGFAGLCRDREPVEEPPCRGPGCREEKPPKPPQTPNGPKEWIEKAWQQYQECVREGTRGFPSRPTAQDVVKQAEEDQLKPMRPNVPGLPAGGNMPTPPGKGPERDLFRTILDIRAEIKRSRVEADCLSKFPLAALDTRFGRETAP